MIVLLDLLLRLMLLSAAPEQWRIVGLDGEVRCAGSAPALDLAERARVSHAWAWSDRSAPRRIEAARIGPTRLPADRARLEVAIAGWGPGRSGRLVAAPLAAWESLPEDLLPAWPVPPSGRLALPLAPGPAWRLRLIEPGAGSWWLELPPGRTSVRLAAAPAQGIEIAVSGPDGRPVRNASLLLLAGRQGRLGPGSRWAFDQIDQLDGGVARFPGLPDADPVTAVVDSEEWAPAVITGLPGELPARLELSAGAALSGRLVDEAGRPVAGARVRLEAALPGIDLAYHPSAAESGADGSFQLRGLPPGRGALLVEAQGFSPYRDQLELSAGSAGAPGATNLGRIELRRGVRVPFAVADDLGQPVPAALIDAGPGLRAETGPDGLAELPGVDPLLGTDFTAEAPGHLPAAGAFRPGSGSLLPVRVVLRRAFLLRGRLLDEDAAAGQGAVSWQAGNRRHREPLGPDGRFALDLEPGVSYEVTLASAAGPALRLAVEAGAAGEVRDLGDLLPPAGNRIAGRVVSAADGSPVAGARVWLPRPSASGPLLAWASHDLLEARTGEDGRFRLAGLPAGPLLLRIDAAGFARAHRTAQVTGGEALADLGDLPLSEGSTVRVRADRRAQEGLARLDLRGDWVELDMLTAEMRDGEASFAHVPPGPAVLSVLSSGKLLCESQVDVGEGSGEQEVECSGSGVRLSGLVQVGGRPAGPGQLLWLAPSSLPSRIDKSATPGGLLLTRSFQAGRPQVDVAVAADGSFASDEVAAGRWQVLWEPAGGAPGPARTVEVPRGVEEYRTVLDFAGTLVSGRVVDREGEPVEGARVRSLADGALALSRPDGGFELWGVEPGRGALQAQLGELRSQVADIEVPADRAADAVRLVLLDRPAPELAVRVTDAEGSPVPGAFVFLEEQGRPQRLLTAGGDGVVRTPIDEPPPGRVRAAALGPGGWAFGAWESWDRAASGLVLRLATAGSLEIESASRAGLPSIVTPQGWDLSPLLTSLGTRPELLPQSPVVVTGLPAGTYTVSLDALTKAASVAAGKSSQVRME